MPGPHLTLTLWQCFEDVGGCDAWLSSWWEDGAHSYQWWTGWHSPKALTNWSWPDKRSGWVLIGHERWDALNGHSWLSEAHYAEPNPSTSPKGRDLSPVGHWVATYNQNGLEVDRVWSSDTLTEGSLYLKGGGDPKGKGKGKGQNLSVCNHVVGM